MKKTANRADVRAAVADGRLRVDLLRGTVETRASRTAAWHEPVVELLYTRTRPLPYARVSFSSPLNGSVRALLHRVVWWAAGKHITPGMELNHENGNKLDNRFANLELVTPKGNVAHAIATGLLDPRQSKNGMFTESEVRAIRSSTETRHALARQHGTDASTISRIVRRVSYRTVT